MESGIASRLSVVKARAEKAAERSGRSSSDVTIIGVSKTVTATSVREALAAGLRDFGENRVQEARDKVPYVSPDARWHMIGHLQTNKVKQALSLFTMIHSLDRLELALEIERQCDKTGTSCDVLVQVNVSGELTKFGTDPDSLLKLVREIHSLGHIHIKGLMTIAPYTDDPETVRPVFRGLRQLAARIADESLPGVEMKQLSMGMSGDFEIAIEEGATMVRIGTAIFGARQPAPVI